MVCPWRKAAGTNPFPGLSSGMETLQPLVFEHALQAAIAAQAFQYIALDTVDIIDGREQTAVLAADLTGLHAVNVGQVDQDALIFAVEFFLNDLPEMLGR